MSKQVAYIALIIAAAFWGFGNIPQKTVLDHMGPIYATMLRCTIAALVVLPFVLAEHGRPTRPGWARSVFGVALTFTAALSVQQVAYLNATVVNASFLVNTATVLTPLIAWLHFGETTGPFGIVAAFLTLVGIGLMADGVAGFTALNAGDIACLVSAVFYAFWMVLQAAPELMVLGVVSTAGAFGLQTVAQRYVPASKAAVLVSGESIFGAIGACTVLAERPPITVCLGAALIFASILLVTIEPEDPVAALLQRNAEES
jgi:drug/metabolite transporter (DMT)-like permease